MYIIVHTPLILCIETTREFTRLPDEILYYYNTWAVVHILYDSIIIIININHACLSRPVTYLYTLNDKLCTTIL